MKIDMRGTQEGLDVPQMDCLESVALELLFSEMTMRTPLSAAEAFLPIIVAMPPKTALEYLRFMLKLYGEGWGYRVDEFAAMERDWSLWLTRQRDSQRDSQPIEEDR